MQSDFHYCCIKVLARKADFNEEEAQAIAFASQYVDDATEHEGMKIEGIPDEASSLVESRRGEPRFEPVCTAHQGIQYLTGLNKDVQLKVYIPFHFVPAEAIRGSATDLFDYRVKPGSSLAGALMEQAVNAYRNASEDARTRALIKIGIALHSYADTWSHQRFSGRQNAADNDIERIHLLEGDTWKDLGFFGQMKLNLIPDVGHAEALNYPDMSHLTWRYEQDKTGIVYTPRNTERFLEAAENIYCHLCIAKNVPPDWKSIVNKIQACLSLEGSTKEKFELWDSTFADVHFSYNSETWRAGSLEGNRWDWDHFQTYQDYESLNYRARKDLKWFWFHLEAKEQRKYIADHIRQDLL